MSTPKIEPDKLHLTAVQMLEGGFTAEPDFRPGSHPREMSINIQVGYDSFLNKEAKGVAIRLITHINGFYLENGENVPAGIRAEYVYQFYFTIDNLDEIISDESAISAILATTLVSISYSTVRGIILERTAGTPFGGVLLPVINPNQFARENRMKIEPHSKRKKGK